MALTRAVKNVFIVEKSGGHKLLRLLEIAEDAPKRILKEEISSADDWKMEARRLEMQGKTEQVDAIRKGMLATVKPDWEPMTIEQYRITKEEALNPENFNKKAKDRLFDFALLHNQEVVIRQLAELKYKRAERFETERSSLYRKYYHHYKRITCR